jgi:hypothetical protein
MGLMVPLIRRYDGYVNKFLGDGIMFFYGAPRENPDHTSDAVATVLAMQQAMEPFNRELAEQGLPTVRMRAGIATGPMVVGDAGPPEAADYTVLGDTVNLAARLESANKATGTYIMLAQRTAELLDDNCLLRPLARLQVIGKSQNIMTYEPLGYTAVPHATDEDKDEGSEPSLQGPVVTEEQRHLCTLTEQMVHAYVAGRFDDCLAAADRLDEKFGPTKLTDLYRSSCREMRDTPAEEFAGQIVLSEK